MGGWPQKTPRSVLHWLVLEYECMSEIDWKSHGSCQENRFTGLCSMIIWLVLFPYLLCGCFLLLGLRAHLPRWFQISTLKPRSEFQEKKGGEKVKFLPTSFSSCWCCDSASFFVLLFKLIWAPAAGLRARVHHRELRSEHLRGPGHSHLRGKDVRRLYRPAGLVETIEACLQSCHQLARVLGHLWHMMQHLHFHMTLRGDV